MKEVKERRFAGLYRRVPYEYFVQSPIGLVPKDNGRKTRLIFHLSYDFKSSGLASVNAHIPAEKCSVKYSDVDAVIHGSFVWHGGTGKVFYSKTDVTSAFRLVPLRASCWWLLILKAEHPVTKEVWYFVDKCLPFGSSSNCAIFQEFSDALKHIVEMKSGRFLAIVNYLDDFLFIAFTVRLCNGLMKIFLDVCAVVGVPSSAEKTVWATRIIVFLGILLDGEMFTLSIPEEKRTKAVNLLQNLLIKRKGTVKEIQQLAGVLNFLNRAIFTGRVFTRRMYAKFAGVVNSSGKHGITRTNQLKSYHHMRLDNEFKSNCRVWLWFLDQSTLKMVSRPFVDLSQNKQLTQLEFYSDASLNGELGFGARFEKEWTYAQWPKKFIKDFSPSIGFVELYGLTVATYIWAKKLSNKRVLVYCDNESVVHMVNNTSSSCNQCMKLLQGIILLGLKWNFRIFARHLRSEENEVADALSRLQFVRFSKLMKKFHLHVVPEPLPDSLWPVTKIWGLTSFPSIE